MQKSYVLGIDTGGTYTDAVVYKFADDITGNDAVIAAAKALTTKSDLCVGITGAVSALDPGLLRQVSRVALSTTLATNACVEGRGGRCGLILVGGDRGVISARAQEFSLPPAAQICFLDGRVDLDGNIAEEFDCRAREKIETLLRDTPCVAISGMLSVRNPAHEYAARDLVTELGGIAVCSRDVAPGELNYIRRASTALLNARLLPIIEEFLAAVRRALAQLGVDAPVSVVRSDGTLMSESFAARRPVETLLSGPTASVVGALNLIGGHGIDAVIADIGGTTTDLALVEGGEPVRTGSGIDIGNWKTSVSSTYIDTYGLGGDSRVILDRDSRLTLCDERVVPLCTLASRWPEVNSALKALAESPYQGLSRRCELLELVRLPKDGELSDREKIICELLYGGPLTFPEITLRAGFELLPSDTKLLETRGYVIRCGFTPTDAMHILGLFNNFDTAASLLGARYFKQNLEIEPEALAREVLDIASYKLFAGIVRLCARRYINGVGQTFPLEPLSRAAWECGDKTLFKPAFTSAATLVAVGAPAAIIAGKAADKLGMKLVIPNRAGVANAVGAAVCTVRCERSIFIRPSFDATGEGGYIVMGGTGNAIFGDYGSALSEAIRQADLLVRADARSRGLTGELVVRINDMKHDSSASTETGKIVIELGTTVTATARAADDI